MIGIELDGPCDVIRKKLIMDSKIFTGGSSDKNTLRLLPSLAVSKDEMDIFLDEFHKVLKDEQVIA